MLKESWSILCLLIICFYSLLGDASLFSKKMSLLIFLMLIFQSTEFILCSVHDSCQDISNCDSNEICVQGHCQCDQVGHQLYLLLNIDRHYVTQCGNYRIFLLLIFYVKSKLANQESRNWPL